MAKAFVLIHISGNLSEEGRRGKETTERQHIEALDKSVDMIDLPINYAFTLEGVGLGLKERWEKQVIPLLGKIKCVTL